MRPAPSGPGRPRARPPQANWGSGNSTRGRVCGVGKWPVEQRQKDRPFGCNQPHELPECGKAPGLSQCPTGKRHNKAAHVQGVWFPHQASSSCPATAPRRSLNWGFICFACGGTAIAGAPDCHINSPGEPPDFACGLDEVGVEFKFIVTRDCEETVVAHACALWCAVFTLQWHAEVDNKGCWTLHWTAPMLGPQSAGSAADFVSQLTEPMQPMDFRYSAASDWNRYRA